MDLAGKYRPVPSRSAAGGVFVLTQNNINFEKFPNASHMKHTKN